MTITRRLAPAAILATTVAVATAACGAGGGSPSAAGSHTASPSPSATSDPLKSWTANKVVVQAEADTVAAPYIRVTGSVSDAGQQVSLDLTMASGKGCRGTVSEQGVGSFAMVVIGKTVWLKPDAAFYQKLAGQDKAKQLAVSLLAGKYLKETTSSNASLGSLAGVCSLRGMMDSASKPTASDPARKTGMAEIDGQRALVLATTKDPGTLYVTDTAKPEMLRIVAPGSSGGQLSFTYYSSPVVITPPPADTVVDGAKYGF